MYLTRRLRQMLRDRETSHCRDERRTFRWSVRSLENAYGHKGCDYNVGSFVQDNVIGKAGTSFIGHEFHHSEIVDIPDDTVLQ